MRGLLERPHVHGRAGLLTRAVRDCWLSPHQARFCAGFFHRAGKAFFLGFSETAPKFPCGEILGDTTVAPMRREDALESIGVAEDADYRTVTRAFRSLAQKYHPGAFPLRTVVVIFLRRLEDEVGT